MPGKSELKRLAAAVRVAEQELHAANGRSALNIAARRLMRAKAELRAAEEAGQAKASGAGAVEATS